MQEKKKYILRQNIQQTLYVVTHEVEIKLKEVTSKIL